MKKSAFLANLALASLLWQDAKADISVSNEANEVMLAAEVTFAAASLYMGVANGRQAYKGNANYSAPLFGIAVGVTSLILSMSSDAEVPVLDVGTGLIAVVGSVLRFPRAERASVQEVRKAGLNTDDSPDLKLLASLRRIEMRVTF